MSSNNTRAKYAEVHSPSVTSQATWARSSPDTGS
jgi:hypothetical protein